MRKGDVEAVLEVERGNQSWTRRLVAPLGNDLTSTAANQLALITGLSGTIWLRGDGAVARLILGQMSVILDLPQALKYEAELKAKKEEKARAAVPKF